MYDWVEYIYALGSCEMLVIVAFEGVDVRPQMRIYIILYTLHLKSTITITYEAGEFHFSFVIIYRWAQNPRADFLSPSHMWKHQEMEMNSLQ
jgi:hypothetical protein